MKLIDFGACEHIAVVVTDPRLPDNPLVDCNQQFLNLTGYARDEVLGRNCRFLAGPDTDPARRKLLSDAIREERPEVVELVNYRKDGTTFLNSVMIAPVHNENRELEAYIGTQIEILSEEAAFVRERTDRAKTLVSQLSPRQREVLALLSRGQRIKQIAYTLGVSERTVKMHRAEMLKALDLSNNAEAIRIAVRAGL